MNPEQTQTTAENEADAGRHFLAVFFLSFMWGSLGVDRFYLGKISTGILKLITFGGLGLWVIVDLVLIMSGTMRDKEGRPMREFARYKGFAAKTVVIFAVILGMVMLLTGAVVIFTLYELAMNLQNNIGDLEKLLPSTNQLLEMNDLQMQ